MVTFICFIAWKLCTWVCAFYKWKLLFSLPHLLMYYQAQLNEHPTFLSFQHLQLFSLSLILLHHDTLTIPLPLSHFFSSPIFLHTKLQWKRICILNFIPTPCTITRIHFCCIFYTTETSWEGYFGNKKKLPTWAV